MRASLIINGVEFGELIQESGISYSTNSRNEKSIVTKDGTVYKDEIKSIKIDISLIDGLYDYAVTPLLNSLKINPATVTYIDYSKQDPNDPSKPLVIEDATCYISDISYGIKESLGDLSILSGVKFTIETQYGFADESSFEVLTIEEVDAIWDAAR